MVDDYDLVATQPELAGAGAAAAARRRPATSGCTWSSRAAPVARRARSTSRSSSRCATWRCRAWCCRQPRRGPARSAMSAPAPPRPGRGRLVTRDRGVEVVQWPGGSRRCESPARESRWSPALALGRGWLRGGDLLRLGQATSAGPRSPMRAPRAWVMPAASGRKVDLAPRSRPVCAEGFRYDNSLAQEFVSVLVLTGLRHLRGGVQRPHDLPRRRHRLHGQADRQERRLEAEAHHRRPGAVRRRDVVPPHRPDRQGRHLSRSTAPSSRARRLPVWSRCRSR